MHSTTTQMGCILEQTVWNTAIYTRISVEEKLKSLADSIANQKAMLTKYAEKNGLSVYKIYVDEGISGGTFDRPGFNKMIEDIENGHVNCVLVKDLKRYGREHIKADYYLEQYFPSKRVRFICPLDHIDSVKNPERMQEIDIPIMNLFNEDYLKKTSISTKSILNIKRRDGHFVGTTVPYGYLRSPKDKNMLIVDESVKSIVQDIFRLYTNYNSISGIAKMLNDQGLLSPANHRREMDCKPINPSSQWNYGSVKNILLQDIYTGDMVQGKTKSYSYKVPKRIPLPKEHWTIVPNTHEAIIDKKSFNKVQEMIALKVKPVTVPSKTPPSILSGLLICKECGKPLQRVIIPKGEKKHYYFVCSTYKKLGSKACTSHRMREEVIFDIVKSVISSTVDNMINVRTAIMNKNKKETYKVIAKLKHSVSLVEAELSQSIMIKTGLYEDYKLNVISQKDYIDMQKVYEKKCNDLQNQKHRLLEQIEDINKKDFTDAMTDCLMEYKAYDTMTREKLVSLIKHITVDSEKNIDICFKFKDELKNIS